jgi:hypothetical protein
MSPSWPPNLALPLVLDIPYYPDYPPSFSCRGRRCPPHPLILSRP